MPPLRAHIVLLSLCLFGAHLAAQTVFTRLPSQYQMFPRDSANLGWFTVEGTMGTDIKTLRAEIAAEPTDSIYSVTQIIPDQAGHFSARLSIPSRLTQYVLRMKATDYGGQQWLLKTVRHLVAGDFFLIAGQSNAEASGTYDSTGLAFEKYYSHPACRGIGASFLYACGDGSLSIADDCRMGRPSARHALWGNLCFVNTWGMKLQYEMAQRSGIPSCFVNAARGALSLLECMPSGSPLDSASCRHSNDARGSALPYDRGYMKLAQAGATRQLRGIFWYQGESEGTQGSDSAARYDEKFARLRAAWKADYPALQKIFVVQTGIGCGGGNHRLVGEIQRRLAQQHDDVVLMSAHGSALNEKQPDNCHFSLEGHMRLADNMLAPALHHFYGEPLLPETQKPAEPVSAQYIAPDRILVEFDVPVFAQQSTAYPDGSTTSITTVFYNQDAEQLNVLSVESRENHLLLSFGTNSSNVTALTYLPPNMGSYSVYAGPWIVNAHNHRLAALGFYSLAVQPLQLPRHSGADAVWPNPATDVINISFRDVSDRHITIFDSFGTRHLDQELRGIERLPVDVSAFTCGLYFIRITTQLGSGYARFVKISP